MAVKIKNIKTLKEFSGINNVIMENDFKDYNVIFANNGTGKTSITRAFKLLIQNNYEHISKYKTINSIKSPEISFVSNSSEIKINEAQIDPKPSFEIEIYNSDFLTENIPLNTEFEIKKLDDKTVVLKGSFVGAETKEIEKLEKENKEAHDRIIIINGNEGDESNNGEINKKMNKLKKIKKN